MVGILIAIPVICQTKYDSMSVVVTTGKTAIKVLPIKLRKTTRQEINMGMDAVLVPETDLPGGNVPKTKAHVLIYQIPMSVGTTQVMLDSITAYIKKITEPPTIPRPDIVSYIDDQDPLSKFTGTWVKVKGQPWQLYHLGNTTSFTGNTGNEGAYTVSIAFDGYKCEWWTEKRINHGIASVRVDNLSPVDIDLYSPVMDNKTFAVYTSPDLGSGTHTITISFTGRKNSQSTEANIIHDAIKVFKKQ